MPSPGSSTVAQPILSRGDVAILVTNLLWGTFWIPLRQMMAAGGGETEATLWGYVTAAGLMLPIAIWKWRAIVTMDRASMAGIALLAVCIAMYSESLNRGQVARILLLFYLTPIWSMIFARVIIGEPITLARGLAIVLGLGGASVMLGLDGSLPLPRNLAEWMGLISGVIWGLGATLLSLARHRERQRGQETTELALVALLLPIAIYGFTLLPGETVTEIAFAAPADSALYWTLAFAAIWILPNLWLIFYGASRIDPTRMGIFLLLDVVIGTGSATMLTNEPFGLAEGLGAVLIVSAAFVEALSHRRRGPPMPAAGRPGPRGGSGGPPPAPGP